MNGDNERIGAALREMAEQAGPPRLDPGAAWRAGRRRRLAALTASAGSMATAAALVPLLLLGVLTGPAQPGKVKQLRPAAASPHPAIEFRQVGRVVDKPCPPGSPGLPGTSRHVCYHLTSTGMTARIESARVVPVPGMRASFEINASLMPAYRHRFEALTAGLVHQHSPRNRMATIAHGVVIDSPRVIGALSGSFQLSTWSTRAAATHFLHRLEGR
jgi:hypothetical protein